MGIDTRAQKAMMMPLACCCAGRGNGYSRVGLEFVQRAVPRRWLENARLSFFGNIRYRRLTRWPVLACSCLGRYQITRWVPSR